jgi:hypothetical protein
MENALPLKIRWIRSFGSFYSEKTVSRRNRIYLPVANWKILSSTGGVTAVPDAASCRKRKKRSLFGLFVAAVEFVDPARGIDEFLFAGEERVTLGADADADFRLGRFGFPYFAASADDLRVFVFRMDFLFHVAKLRFKIIFKLLFVMTDG